MGDRHRRLGSRPPVRRRGTSAPAGWATAAIRCGAAGRSPPTAFGVYFAGDTASHPEFAAIAAAAGPFDLVMLPIGAYEPRWFMESVHMNPEDAIDAYRALTSAGPARPPCLAMHWGTFRLTDEPVEEPPARFALRWREAGLPDAANWTLAVGETRCL